MSEPREFIKKLARPGEVIPACTKYISEKIPTLTASQSEWAKSVADSIPSRKE